MNKLKKHFQEYGSVYALGGLTVIIGVVSYYSVKAVQTSTTAYLNSDELKAEMHDYILTLMADTTVPRLKALKTATEAA